MSNGNWRDDYEYYSKFERKYKCVSAATVEKPQLELGDKIIMPASALDILAGLQVDYPMMFKLHNPAVGRVSHCGVLEFVAEEGKIYLPSWMMANMHLQEGDYVQIQNVSLPKGTYVKLQPHTKDFVELADPRAVLENRLRTFSCLTIGDTIVIDYNDKKFSINIIDAKPNNAVSIIETDCEVDFAPPVDYEEVQEPEPSLPSTDKQPEEPARKLVKLEPFTGLARRLDGRLLESVSSTMDLGSGPNGRSNGSMSSNSTTSPRSGKLVFCSKETPQAASKTSHNQPQEVEKPKFQPFTGKKYSLQD